MSAPTMKAVMQTAFGEPAKCIKILDMPMPTIDEDGDMLLLKVKAVSLNPLDWYFVMGNLKMVFKDPMPAPMGVDVSGVVVKAGKKAGFKEGDEVFGLINLKQRGSLAQYCTIKGENCALKPTTLSHEETACLPVAGGTSLQAYQLHFGPKDVAFIPAGLGGVSSIALQLAKPYAGFQKTITTVSTSKVTLVKELVKDLDEIIDYKKDDPAKVIPANSCDFVLDIFGTPAIYTRYARKPAPGAKDSPEGKSSIISIFAPPCADKAQDGWELRAGLAVRMAFNMMDWWTRTKIPGWIHYDSFFSLPSGSDMKVLKDLAEEGKLKPVIDKVYPLDQALEAFAHAQAGSTGKVVIRME